MENDTKKPALSLAVFRDILQSTKRISAIIWREKRGLALLLASVLLVLATTPFLSSGSLGLLVNELIKSATLRTVGESLVWAVAFLVSNLLPSISYFLLASHS